LIGIGGSDPCKPLPRPTDLTSTPPRDLPARHESHLTPLVNARLGADKPEHAGRLRADALDTRLHRQTPADRLTAKRSMTAAATLAHGASAVHVATALGLETAGVAAALPSRADGHHQHAGTSAAARDEVHALPDDPEAGR
jgi:hypothetical protein